MSETKSTKEEVLLGEYQVCNETRNHYDTIGWTIGSIFIAISVAIFGISLTEEVMHNFLLVLILAFFSITVIMIWYIFVRHIYPYVWTAVIRCHEIEVTLRKRGYEIGLHKKIYDYKQSLKGNYIVFLLVFSVIFAWYLRLAIFWHNYPVLSISISIVFMLGLVAFSILHFRQKDNWGEKIRTALEKEAEYKHVNENV